MQTPSLGRVVLVLVNAVTNSGSDIAPATVVHVGGERDDGSWTVNLKIDLDSATTAKWITNVRLFADEMAARTFDGDAAFWPPRTH